MRFRFASVFAFVFATSTLAVADVAATFTARVTLNLCPEFRLGGTTYEIHYAVPGSDTFQNTAILSQTLNTSDGTGTFDIALPTIYATAPIRVAAYCRTSQGLSDPSNIEVINNCDALSLLDTDGDGLTNNLEDTDCGNFFSPGDLSNPDNPDTDGDGARDLVERVSGTSPTNAASSPAPLVIAGAPFDPDGDGESNPVVWRPSNGTWYIKDFGTAGVNQQISWGLNGDIPFVYDPKNFTSDVGVVRLVGNDLVWFFHGAGFLRSDNSRLTQFSYGIFGDILIPGPWEEAGVTSPAVARLYGNVWSFIYYRRNGTIQTSTLGQNGDLLRAQDYDGDGLFDAAVFRPSNQQTIVRYSSNGSLHTFNFGSGTADLMVRGDITGDGIGDISFWEPITGLFFSLTSDNGFNDTLGRAKNTLYYKELSLGTYGVESPLPWQKRGGRIVYTVIDHRTGVRRYRPNNSSLQAIQSIQWGLPGDAQG